jgi:hypothetical protein
MVYKKHSNQVKKVSTNKSVHFDLNNDVHRKLRALMFLREFSLQGFFRLMAESFVNNNPYLSNLIDDRIRDIKNNKINHMKNVNKKELYDVIEQNSPFKEEN